jgi:hypothetical protein
MRPILFDEAGAYLFAGINSLPFLQFNQRGNQENATLTQATVIGMMTADIKTALNIAKRLAIFAPLLAVLFLGQSPHRLAGRAKPSHHSGEFIS